MQTYLASGTPTVTFGVGFGELLEDGVEVLKTRGSEPAELADKLMALIDDPELAERIGRGGRAAAQRLFDPVANTDALLAHYEANLER
jgi:glycosyltransferase involved in cell wall biosynthesis